MGAQVTMAAGSSLSELAYQHIKRDILACRTMPGTMLAAHDLAERLEVSRTPVHEALKSLAQEGLVRVMPRKGYVVTPVSIADVREIFELRLALEVQGAGLCAERAAPADLASILDRHTNARRTLATDSRDDLDYPEFLIGANRDFHVSIAALSGNERLARSVAGLLDETQRVYFLYFLSPRALAQGDPHRDVLRALQTGDAKMARDAMAGHVRDTEEGMLDSLNR